MNEESIDFFATERDLRQGLENFSTDGEYLFHLMEMLDEEDAPRYMWMDIPDLGTPVANQSMLLPMYLVRIKDEEPIVQRVPQRRGGVKYTIELVDNPGSIVFKPGGMYREECLLNGSVYAETSDESSAKMYGHFRKTFFADFQKIKTFLVGPQASEYLDAGGRLVINAKASDAMALKR